MYFRMFHIIFLIKYLGSQIYSNSWVKKVNDKCLENCWRNELSEMFQFCWVLTYYYCLAKYEKVTFHILHISPSEAV